MPRQNYRYKVNTSVDNFGLMVVSILLVLAWRPAWSEDADNSAKALFETNCSACHSLELPRSQRLDRNTWRWVVDDMVNKFGATWITEKQQDVIIDYLVKNYGPDRPRD